MVLKLHGTPYSVAVRRAGVVLVEKNIQFEFVPIDTPNWAHKMPEYLEKHPFGQIPYLDDDGFILYESRAIARYIAEKYADQGTPLIPAASDLQARALFEQAASVELCDFDPYAGNMHRAFNHPKRQGLEPDIVTFNRLNAELGAKLDVYERILSKQRYISGETVSLVDLFHLPFGANIIIAGTDVFETRPNVARWWKDITSRPSWQQVKDGVKSNL